MVVASGLPANHELALQSRHQVSTCLLLAGLQYSSGQTSVESTGKTDSEHVQATPNSFCKLLLQVEPNRFFSLVTQEWTLFRYDVMEGKVGTKWMFHV